MYIALTYQTLGNLELLVLISVYFNILIEWDSLHIIHHIVSFEIKKVLFVLQLMMGLGKNVPDCLDYKC